MCLVTRQSEADKTVYLTGKVIKTSIDTASSLMVTLTVKFIPVGLRVVQVGTVVVPLYKMWESSDTDYVCKANSKHFCKLKVMQPSMGSRAITW